MAKVIMVQGTMSNAGKSLIVAGLCRIFAQDGYRVAPFKSQNMALNSYITEDGLEMGRAQVMQAEAAGVKPSVLMNPILLKPTNDVGSQVIVKGEVLGNMRARDYFAYKKKLVPTICEAFSELEKQADIIVMEGAGSPAEINLKSDDIVNMGLAKLVDAPVLLVGDIDRGGVFAQLLGTLILLEEDEKARVKGLIINKFRGDKTILDPGVEMLEERGDLPTPGGQRAVSILLFAYSTTLGWSHYGTKAVEYLFGTTGSRIYKVVFVCMTVVGATMKLGLAWDLSDTFNGLMMIPNLIGVLVLSGTVVDITRNYFDRRVKGKDIEPMWSAFLEYQKQEEAEAAAEEAELEKAANE